MKIVRPIIAEFVKASDRQDYQKMQYLIDNALPIDQQVITETAMLYMLAHNAIDKLTIPEDRIEYVLKFKEKMGL